MKSHHSNLYCDYIVSVYHIIYRVAILHTDICCSEIHSFAAAICIYLARYLILYSIQHWIISIYIQRPILTHALDYAEFFLACILKRTHVLYMRNAYSRHHTYIRLRNISQDIHLTRFSYSKFEYRCIIFIRHS